jgi:hypothetical protein
MYGSHDDTLNLHSSGLWLGILNASNITVNDWNATDRVHFIHGSGGPTQLSSDGHGGTELTVTSGGTTYDIVDFRHTAASAIHLA